MAADADQRKWHKCIFPLTNGSDVKYIFLRCGEFPWTGFAQLIFQIPTHSWRFRCRRSCSGYTASNHVSLCLFFPVKLSPNPPQLTKQMKKIIKHIVRHVDTEYVISTCRTSHHEVSDCRIGNRRLLWAKWAVTDSQLWGVVFRPNVMHWSIRSPDPDILYNRSHSDLASFRDNKRSTVHHLNFEFRGVSRIAAYRHPRDHPFLVGIIVRYRFCYRSGRNLAEIFMVLPTRKELPDYYQVIKHPLDIRKIRVRAPQHWLQRAGSATASRAQNWVWGSLIPLQLTPAPFSSPPFSFPVSSLFPCSFALASLFPSPSLFPFRFPLLFSLFVSPHLM